MVALYITKFILFLRWINIANAHFCFCLLETTSRFFCLAKIYFPLEKIYHCTKRSWT